jgi:hypothetical protein
LCVCDCATQALLQSTRDELHTETLALLEAKKEIKEVRSKMWGKNDGCEYVSGI